MAAYGDGAYGSGDFGSGTVTPPTPGSSGYGEGGYGSGDFGSGTVVVVPPVDPPPPVVVPGTPGGLVWESVGQFEAGVDRGVFYGKNGVVAPWSGLISVEETGGDAATAYYMDGVPYLYLPKPKPFEATINAYTYPDAFSAAMGVVEVADGMYLDSQMGSSFDLSYRTLIGNTTQGSNAGYKIHLVYNATVAPSSIEYESLSGDINPVTFSWDIQAVPITVEGYRPTAHIIIDTRHLSGGTMAEIETMLYGEMASMPSPQDIYEILQFGNQIIITYIGNGLWTAEGSYKNVYLEDDRNFQIDNVNAVVDVPAGTYTVSSTF